MIKIYKRMILYMKQIWVKPPPPTQKIVLHETCWHKNAFTVIGKRDGLFYQERHCPDCNRIVASCINIEAPDDYLEEMRRNFPFLTFISEEEFKKQNDDKRRN